MTGRQPMISASLHPTAPYAALVLRITLAGLFIAHLGSKFFIRGLDAWWASLSRLGYPNWVLAYTLGAEVLGTLLLLGMWTRWISIVTLPMMLGATHFWMTRKGFFFTDAGWELPFVWSLMLVVQALLGDGAYALRRHFRGV